MWVKVLLFGRSSKGAMGVFSTLVFLLVGLHSGAISQAGPISPDALSGLQAWYRVDQGITLSGTQVSGWQDSSGLGRNMAQATSDKRPTLISSSVFPYFPMVHFDGVNDYLEAGDVEVHSNTTGLTVIAVVKPSAVTSGASSPGLILSKFAGSEGNRAWRLGIDWFDVQQSPGNSWNANTRLAFPDSADPIAGQWNIVTGSWLPGEAAKGYLVPWSGPNAFQEIYAGAATQAVTQIVDSSVTLKMGTDTGASQPWLSGDLAEVIVYNRALTNSERQGVAQYLQQKYAPQTVQTGPLLVNVNFEGTGVNAHNQPLPPGYRIDNGAPFAYRGDGLWYGWRLNDGTPIDVSSVGRNRNATTSPDERFDTLIHLYNSGGTPYVPYTWQLSVPNGTYWVRAVFGESTGGTSTNHVLIQGTAFTDPDPNLSNDWDEYFGQFTVTDGKLTITPQSGVGAKICFAQVASVFQPQIAINFEGTGTTNASNASLPSYYLKDSGAAFGDRESGYRYGWVDQATGNPIENPHGYNRDSDISPDERYDTINHLWNGGTQHYNWEIELPNANYFVLAVFGEPDTEMGTAADNVWIENVRFYDPDPNKGGEWDLFMGVVTVSDGKLTISDMGLAQTAKIAFLEITLVPEPSTWVLGALGGIGLLVMGGYRRLRRTGQS